MRHDDYEMREWEGIGWIAHRRRVRTKLLILTATIGTAVLIWGVMTVDLMSMLCGTFLLGIAAIAAN